MPDILAYHKYRKGISENKLYLHKHVTVAFLEAIRQSLENTLENAIVFLQGTIKFCIVSDSGWLL